MAQLAVSAAGAVGGFYIGGPVGAQIGWTAGSMIGASLFPEKGKVPGVGDLRAPSVQYGSPLVRLHGTNRTSGALAWYSPKRVIAGSSGGKGTPTTTTDTAEIDLLYIVSVDSDVHSLLRVWVNGEMKWTGRADSDAGSIDNSAATDAWTSIEFLDGSATQLPHPVIEAIEGVGNVPAYRHRQCVLIEGLQLGQSGQLPLVEFEVSKAVADTEDLIFYAPFTTDNVDTIAPATTTITTGPGVGANSSSGVTISWDEIAVTATSLRFYDFDLTPDKLDLSLYAGQDVSISVTATFVATALGGTNEFRFFEYSNGTVQAGFGWYLDDLRCSYNDGPSDNTTVGFTGQTRFKLVFLADGVTAQWYMDDVLVRTRSVSRAAIALGDIYIRIANDCRIAAGTFKDLRMFVGVLPTTPPLIDLADIVRAEWALVDDVANIDATDLEGVPVRGFQAAGSIRSAMEMLSAIFHFGAVCSDKLYFRLRGGSIVATIDADDLAAGEEGPAAEPFAPVVADDAEIPERVALTYPNWSDDYANGTETGDRGSGSTVVLSQQSNVVMTPSEAKIAVETYTAQLGIAATTATISLSCAYAALEPTDPITVPDQDGNTYRMRIARDTYGGGIHALELVRDDTSSLVGLGITDEDYTPSLTVPAPDETIIVLLDIPILRDVDDDPGFYAVAKGSSHGSTLYSSLDDVNYVEEVTIPTQSVFGVCTTTLPDWTGPRVFDEVSALTVDVDDGTLSSSTRAAMLADQSVNACAIGLDGRWELCQFRTATLVSPGVYTLTGWLRGARGTEWASIDHVAAESFVMLTAAGARRVAMQQSEIGIAEYWKGVSAGRLLSSATGELFTDNGVGQKPFAPVDLRKEGDDSAVVVTWKRRTRLAPRFCGTGGINVPLGEAAESYDVDLFNPSDVLVSSTTVTEAEWVAPSSEVFGNLAVPVSELASIGGELVGIRADSTSVGAESLRFVRHTTAGALVAEGSNLGSTCYQWTNDGDNLYACMADLVYPPGSYLNSKIKLYSRTALGTLVASYTSPTAGDLHGVACDGTNIWVTEFYGGNLRKLNKTTLASVATYALDTGLGRLKHYSGSLWITSDYTDEVIEWDIGSTSELQRFSVVRYPHDLLIVGTLLFVRGGEQIGVYTAATGALVATVDGVTTGLNSNLCEFASDYVAAVAGTTITLIDKLTGIEARTIDAQVNYLGQEYVYLRNVAGANGDTLYATIGAPGASNQTVAFELSAPALTGYSLVVYQNSANIGRGYAATLEL
jgi:hypothetical protein